MEFSREDISEKLKKEAEEYAQAKLSEYSENRKKHMRSLIRVGVMFALTTIVLILTALQSVHM